MPADWLVQPGSQALNMCHLKECTLVPTAISGIVKAPLSGLEQAAVDHELAATARDAQVVVQIGDVILNARRITAAGSLDLMAGQGGRGGRRSVNGRRLTAWQDMGMKQSKQQRPASPKVPGCSGVFIRMLRTCTRMQVSVPQGRTNPLPNGTRS